MITDQDRQRHGAQIAYRIRAELVCCRVYGVLNDDGRVPQPDEVDEVEATGHGLCYWAEGAARLAETPAVWQGDPDECAQGCPERCRHKRAADDLTHLDEAIGRQGWPSMSIACFNHECGRCAGCFECACHSQTEKQETT